MSDPAAMFHAVIGKLNDAKSRSEMIGHAQQIQHLPEHWQRDKAAEIVRAKLDEFKKR